MKMCCKDKKKKFNGMPGRHLLKIPTASFASEIAEQLREGQKRRQAVAI